MPTQAIAEAYSMCGGGHLRPQKHPNSRPQNTPILGFKWDILNMENGVLEDPLAPSQGTLWGVISSPKGIRTTCKPSQTATEGKTMCGGPFEALKTPQSWGPKHPNFGLQMGYSQYGKRYARRPLGPVTRGPLGCYFIT